jgi:serine protease
MAEGPAAVPGEVVVGLADGGERLIQLPAGEGVNEAIARLEGEPEVEYATPNWVATAAWHPNDPGTSGLSGGWDADQWNFLPVDVAGASYGIGVTDAWDSLIAADARGARGVTIAVVDTGIAYRPKGKRFRRVPDIAGGRFAHGRDLVDDDRVPLDEHGHGTHVAGTIGQQTGNSRGVTGIAYNAKLMPVRALGSKAMGTAFDVARGIKFAARNGADVINLSLTFPTCPASRCVDECKDIAGVCRAVKKAVRSGAVVVVAAGNGGGEVSFPARIAKGGVIAVGATGRDGSLAAYSARGDGLELVAPGGELGTTGCTTEPPDDAIIQMSFAGASRKQFCLQERIGTSMASAHVAGVAALVIASGVLGDGTGQMPRPRAVEKQLRCSAYDLGAQGFDPEFGSGLLDAAAAVAEGCTG